MYQDEELREMKIRDMIAIYKQVATECFTQRQALVEVCKHEAPRFYILPHTAYCNLRNLFWGEGKRPRPKNERMYNDLYMIVMNLSSQPEYSGMSLRRLCEIAVKMKAPEFYVSPDTFRGMLAEERKRMIKKLRRK